MSCDTKAPEIRFAPACDIAEHPALEHVLGMGEEDYCQLRESIVREGKILQPLLCHEEGSGKLLVIDGRTRLRVAKECDMRLVPVIVDNSSDPLATAFTSTIARRHLSKAGKALMIFEAHPELRRSRIIRGRQNLLKKRGMSDVAREKAVDQPSFKELSDRYGFPRQYLSHLALICDSQTDDEWSETRRKLLSAEAKLEALYAGIKGQIATKAQKRTPVDHFELLERSFEKELPHRLKAWPELSQEQRDDLIGKFCGHFDEMPIEFLKRVGARMTEWSQRQES